MGKYEIKPTSNSQYRWTFKASNGLNIMTSETYVSKEGCRNGITSSKANLADSNFGRLTSVRYEPYFVQKASGNHEVLATSEMYSSTHNRDHAIQVVKNEAPSAIVVDLT